MIQLCSVPPRFSHLVHFWSSFCKTELIYISRVTDFLNDTFAR